MVAFAIFTVVGPALALAPVSLNDFARLVIPIQNEENQELWRDLQTGETPPEAAVGNEGQAHGAEKLGESNEPDRLREGCRLVGCSEQ